MPETPELREIVERVVGWAMPNEQVEAFASRNRSASVRIHEGEVESFTSAEPAGVGIRVIVDGRLGFASAGSLDETVLKESLEEARDNATFSEPDEHLMLATPDDVARIDLDLYREATERLSTEEKIARAKELEAMVLGSDPRLRVHTSSWSDSIGEQAIASTTGIRSYGKATRASASVYALADENGQTQTGGGFSTDRSPEGVSLEEARAEAVDETLRMLGATKPKSGRMPAILMQDVTSSFLSIIGSTLSGEAVLKGRSLFADRVGQSVGSPVVHLVDDPTDPDAMGAWPEDDEGLASRRVSLVEGGVLQGFVHDTYSARRLGTTSTASAIRGYSSTPKPMVRALSLVSGTKSLEELIAEIGNGVLVQSVSGLHSGVNPVSGDFSVGASGLMIRDGAIAEPVQEMTIASTLQRMLLEVVAVGNDRRWLGSTAGVSLVIGDVSLGGR